MPNTRLFGDRAGLTLRRDAFAGGLGAVVLVVAVGGAAPEPFRGDDPRVAEVERRCERATHLFYERDLDEAIGELELVIDLRPDHAEAHHLLGLLYFGRERLDRAAAHLRRAVRLRPDFAEARADLGAVYLAEHRWQEATVLFAGLTRLADYPGAQLAHARLGWALHNLGRYAEAATEYRMAIYLDAAPCQNYGQLGLAYEGMGDRLLALDAWQEATRRCPGDPEPFFHLGRLLSLSGDTARASAAFRRCRALEPSSPFGRRCAARGL